MTDNLEENLGNLQNPESPGRSRDNLVPPDASRTDALVVSAHLKLKCSFLVLALIALGFIASVIETEINTRDVNPAHGAIFGPSGWICWGLKCGYSIAAIAAIFYLRNVVLVQSVVPVTQVNHPTRPDERLIVQNIRRYIPLPEGLGSCPSTLFVITFILFAVVFCMSGGIEIICGAINAVDCQQHEKCGPEMAEVVRRSILMVFVLIQTEFFFVHYRSAIQWQLPVTWLCGCQILATNIAAWFFTVGLEVREIGSNHSKAVGPNDSYCSYKFIDKVSRALYPFVIEYYVMGAFMAITLVSNAGRVGAFLQSLIGQTVDPQVSVRHLMRPQPHEAAEWARSEFAALRRHSKSFFLGLGFVLISLIASVFVAIKEAGEPDAENMHLVFYCVLVLLYLSGLACIIVLLCSIEKRTRGHGLSSIHLIERALLWLGAAAITVNDSYTFWITWTKLDDTNVKRMSAITVNDSYTSWIPRTKLDDTNVKMESANHVLLGISCALNVFQSLLQVYALECALMRKFNDMMTGRGRAVLNMLILLNVAEWIFNTVCFSFFFPKDQMDDALVLSLLAMPLQVFYRFHSAACIHDFKRHCEDHGGGSPPAGEVPEAAAASAGAEAEPAQMAPVRVTFPNIVSTLSGSIN